MPSGNCTGVWVTVVYLVWYSIVSGPIGVIWGGFGIGRCSFLAMGFFCCCGFSYRSRSLLVCLGLLVL